VRTPPNPDQPKASAASLFIIFFTVFIDLVGFGIIIPILQPYAREFNATDLEAGVLMGIFSAVQFFVIPVWGWLSDRYGRKPIILIGLFGTVISYLIMGFAHSLGMLFAGRILAGLSAGKFVAAQAYVADITPPEKRAHGMGMIGIAFGLGFILGPVIGGTLSQHELHIAGFTIDHFAVPSFAAAIFSLLALGFGIVRLRESLPPERRVLHGKMRHPILDITRVVADKPLFRVILSNFLYTVTFSMWETVFVLFVGAEVLIGVEDKILSKQVGYLFGFAGLLSAFIQGGLIRPMVKRFGESSLAKGGFAFLALGYLGFVAFYFWGTRGEIFQLVPVLVLVGMGIGLLNPTISAMVSKLVGPERQGEVLGAFQGLGSLGRVIGPMTGAVLFAKVGHIAPYLCGALLVLPAIALIWPEFHYHQVTLAEDPAGATVPAEA
jgi:MFS family permease